MRARPPVVVAFADRLQELLGERLVVVSDELSPGDITGLVTLHETLLAEQPEAAQLEGDYVPREWLTPTGTARPVPFFRHGRLEPRLELMLSADNIANMRQGGITVYGPRSTEILPEVTAGEVRDAVRAMIRDEPDAPTERAAAKEILDFIRSLCAIETGLPTTKSDGVRWALERVAPRWYASVLRADDVRRGAATNDDEQTLRRALADMRAELLLA